MSARDAALLELDAKRLPGWMPDLLASRKRVPLNDPRDRALADRLVVGVVKNLFFLEDLAAHYSGKRLDKIDPAVSYTHLDVYKRQLIYRGIRIPIGTARESLD